MTSKLVVNTIEADTGISSVSFASSISMNSTAKFHFSAAGVDIGADTNINRPSAGVLGFNINDSQKVVITSNGRLGIGTDNPASNLQVDGTSLTLINKVDAANTLITVENTATGNAGLKLKNSNVEYTILATDGLRIMDEDSGGLERLRIASDGKIGINSTSPSTPLEIHTAASAAWKFRINTSVSDGAGFYQRANGDFELVLRDASNNNNYIAGTSGALQFATSGSERLRITSDGDLGIGDNNPNIRLTVVDTGTENLVRLGRSDASGHASHTVNVKASKDYYHHFKMEASSFNLDCYNGSAMIDAFKVHNTGFAELAGAADVRLTLGNAGTSGTNNSNWVRGVNNNLYYNAAASDHLWEIGGAEHMRLDNSGNLFLRSGSANYVVLGSSGDSTGGGTTNNMNWIRGNGTNTQYNSAGGFHSWEVSGSEKMRLTHDGDLLVGTTTNASSNGVGLKLNYGTTNPTFNCVINQSAGNHSFYHLYNTNASHNAYRFYVTVNGGIANHSGNNTNLSDERMKKNITNMGSVYNTFKQFTFKDFNYIDDGASDIKKHGLIAQDVETIDADLITEDFKIAPDSEGNDVYRKALKEEQFMMIGMKALQEAITKIETLEAKVAALEGS